MRANVCICIEQGLRKDKSKGLEILQNMQSEVKYSFLILITLNMNSRVKSQALLKQILKKAALNLTGSCHSSSEVIHVKKTIIKTDFSSDGFQYVGKELFAPNLL